MSLIALAALGNRTWGDSHGTHHLGCTMMTVALLVGHHYPLWAIPIIYGLVYLFRVSSPGPWFEVAEGMGGWQPAFLRALWILPLGAGLALLNYSLYPLLASVAGIGAVPTIYFASYKLSVWLKGKSSKYPFSYTDLAELLAGTYIGVLGL